MPNSLGKALYYHNLPRTPGARSLHDWGAHAELQYSGGAIGSGPLRGRPAAGVAAVAFRAYAKPFSA